MRIDSTEISTRFTAHLNVPCVVAVTSEELPLDELSAGETQRLSQFSSPRRRSSWLRGRRALKQLLSELGRPVDTAALSFPNPSFSISHSGNLAVAFATIAEKHSGVGVDIEIPRTINPSAVKFFLTHREIQQAPGADSLLRLWTIKEALLKANPNNIGTFYADYEVDDLDASSGSARVLNGSAIPMRYCSIAFDDCLVAGAITGERIC